MDLARNPLFLTALALVAPASTEAGPPPSSAAQAAVASRVARMGPEIESRFRETGLPSLQLALTSGGTVVLSRAYGLADVGEGIPATVDTVYPIASNTKVFVATMLMQLAEAGKVTLDTPVAKLLPEYRVRSRFPGTTPTTLRQLAQHTSGLPRDAPVNFWSDYSVGGWLASGGRSPVRWYVPKEELLATLPGLELVYPPNSRQQYSNLGMALLGMALERAAMRSFTDYVQQQILDPLGMSHSGFFLESPPARRATGYVFVSPSAPPLVAPRWDLGSALYSGGLSSTAEDLARFLAFQCVAPAGPGRELLPRDAVRRMHRDGMGWGRGGSDEHPSITHAGGHLGYFSYVRAIPSLQLGVAVTTNSLLPTGPTSPALALADAVLDQLKATALEAERRAAEVPVGLDEATGRYALPGGVATLLVEREGEGLLLQLVEDAGFRHPLVRVGPRAFGFADDPRIPPVSFEVGPSGRVRAVAFLEHLFARVGGDETLTSR